MLYDQLYQWPLIQGCASRVKSSKPKHLRKTSKGIDNTSIADYFLTKDQEKINLSLLIDALKTHKFSFKKLKGISIPKENSETDRLITAPTVEDRIVHKALLATVNPILYPYINTGASYCGVKKDIGKRTKNGLNTRSAIKKLIQHLENGKFWILKADIEKFFDRVPKERLLTKIQILLAPDKSLDKLFSDIIYFQLGNVALFENNKRILLPKPEIGISQGSSLSPIFANVYLEELDRAIQEQFGDILIRYVDDVLIVAETDEEIFKIKTFVDDYLLQLGLNFSKKKTEIKNLKQSSIEFLGLKIDRHNIREKNIEKILEKLRSDIFNLNHKDYSHLDKHEEKIERMNQKIHGIFNYYRYYHVTKLTKTINSIIANQVKIGGKSYKGLIPLNSQKLDYVISEEDWQELFKSKKTK